MINKNNKKGNTMTKKDKEIMSKSDPKGHGTNRIRKSFDDYERRQKKEKVISDLTKVKKISDIMYNITDLLYYTSKKTLGEAIEVCRNDKDAKEGILRTSGVRLEVIEELYKTNIITDDIATMLYKIEQNNPL
tara:strand:+ start:83 stop:481 length:399 start_codon:yes stop_codon:yes gene_type:complete